MDLSSTKPVGPADRAARPRIWAMGISRLRELFREIAGEFDERADVRIVTRAYEDALSAIAEAGTARPDVIVAAGSNGAFLKTRAQVPVVVVSPTGFDVMQALARARRDASRIALVSAGETPPEVRRFVAAYGLDVQFASYQSAQEAEACVHELRDRGIETIVGPGLVTDLAASAGMGAVFLYSHASVRKAVDTALEVAYATHAEAFRRQRLDNLLQHLRDGVVALDARGRVEAINERLASALGVEPAAAVGRALVDLRPELRKLRGEAGTALARGESGTGKEMIAQSLHALSARRSYPFVAVNCGAFPEALLESELFGYEEGAFTGARRGGKTGLFEAAHRGTLFLDEIGEMPPSLQSRLLRVLQEREVIRLGSTEPIRIDVRVIAATHRPLLAAVEAGTFRADLYYRLNILNVGLPPLRERAADIPALAATLLVQAARREPRLAERLRDATDAARVLGTTQAALARYRWPGNVRELQNVIERIAVELAEEADENDPAAACGTLGPDALQAIAPELFAAPPDTADADDAQTLHARRRRAEADEIRAVLDACGGDRDRACAMLGISKTTLWRKLSVK